MRLIIHKSKSHTRHKVSSVKRFKSKIKHNSSMTKHRSHKSHKKSGFGKISGFKIPVIGGLLKNDMVKKVALASGTVAIVGAGVQLLNQPSINKIWSNQIVRSAVAFSTGDVIGAVGTYALENPNLFNRMSSGSNQMSMAGFA